MAPSVRDAAAAQVRERAEAIAIGGANGENLAKLVVRDRDRQAGAARRAVFDAAQADVEVAARRGRVEAGEADLDEARSAAETRGQQLRHLDIEAHHPRGIAGSASTNGAPPSASPPHRSSCRSCAVPTGGQSTAVHTSAARRRDDGIGIRDRRFVRGESQSIVNHVSQITNQESDGTTVCTGHARALPIPCNY